MDGLAGEAQVFGSGLRGEVGLGLGDAGGEREREEGEARGEGAYVGHRGGVLG